MILVGGMLPSGLLIPTMEIPPKVLIISSSWQIPALLLCSLVSGPRSGVIAAVAYLTVGIFYLPVFHGGGGYEYISQPGFSYLTGFIPASWLSGQISKQRGMNNLLLLTLAALSGLLMIHIFGIISLSIGSILNLWSIGLADLLFNYSLTPLISQISLCPAIAILALFMRRLLLVE